jgi:small subunit ribosomal protein S15
MVFSKEEKNEIITKFKEHDGDTGSPKVQVALLTERISYLTDHFKKHKKDFHSRSGLLKLVSRRRKLLAYIKNRSVQEYKDLIKSLGIRK